MSRDDIINGTLKIFHECPGNIITEDIAIDQEMVGLVMFDEPLIGFGSADDKLFQEYKNLSIIGPWHKAPREWLDDANTVVSFFLPFTEKVKSDNRKCNDGPAAAWLHARIEGQSFIAEFMRRVKEWLDSQGTVSCVPALDSRFHTIMGGDGNVDYPGCDKNTYSSNWSERHVAYVCGLGTFGLSKGIITQKGMAGRFGSVIIDTVMSCDTRPYKGVYDYCTQCGACIKRCPVHAISFENGKDHTICGPWVSQTKQLYAPRYGCGLCQTRVPCESGIPKRR